jgi:phosphatidylglycerophosphatase A
MKLRNPGWPRHLPTNVVLACARLGPVGPNLPAPGTWGSAAGIAYFYAVFVAPGTGAGAALLLNLAGLYLAVALCGAAEIRLGKTDPGEVILDEVVAMPLCFLGWPLLVGPAPAWAVLLAGFAVFRFFDILKPLGIAKLQSLPGGWGVVIDDVAAALATCGVLHAAQWAWHHFHA